MAIVLQRLRSVASSTRRNNLPHRRYRDELAPEWCMDRSVRASIPAVHEWHLERILAELGLLEALNARSLHCTNCEVTLSLAEIGALIRGHGDCVLLTCDRVRCLETAATRVPPA